MCPITSPQFPGMHLKPNDKSTSIWYTDVLVNVTNAGKSSQDLITQQSFWSTGHKTGNTSSCKEGILFPNMQTGNAIIVKTGQQRHTLRLAVLDIVQCKNSSHALLGAAFTLRDDSWQLPLFVQVASFKTKTLHSHCFPDELKYDACRQKSTPHKPGHRYTVLRYKKGTGNIN